MQQSHQSPTLHRRHRLMSLSITACLLGSLVIGGSRTSLAQSDGTDADLSGTTECVIVRADALPTLGSEAGTPASATPQASPVADTATPVSDLATPIDNATPQPAQASPVASNTGTPEASPVVDGVALTPNEQVQSDLTNTVESLFSCLNDRTYDVYAAITSDSWRGSIFGLNEPLSVAEFMDFAAVLPVTTSAVVEVSNLQILDTTTVSVDVTYTSASQLLSGTWTFAHSRVEGLPSWVLQSEQPLTVVAPEGASSMKLTMDDGSYTIAPTSVSGPDLVMSIDNPTLSIHEALVLKLDDGVEADSLLQSTTGSLPNGATFIGQATLSPGTAGDLVLVGLAPGTYTVVDLLPDANGIPNLSAGMEITFTITP